jgi:hypothetical protein
MRHIHSTQPFRAQLASDVSRLPVATPDSAEQPVK